MPNAWRRYLLILSSISLSIGLMGCAALYNLEDEHADELNNLMAMRHTDRLINFKQKLTEVREASLKEIALGAGAQGGLAWQAKEFNQLLDKSSPELDAIFNFNSLLLNNGVLPPVITEGRKTWNLADDTGETIRAASANCPCAL